MTKYGAKRTTVNGHTFASKKEAARYQELRLLERAGHITGLELQPRYELQPSFKHGGKTIRAITYVADFRYYEDGALVVEDAKGMQTQMFRMKRKMLLFVHGIDVRLT